MDKKSVSATILVFYLAVIFSVVGACFSSFVFVKTKIEVKSVAIQVGQGVEVFEDEMLTRKVTKLKLSELEFGLKPVTGEIDAVTNVPSTITCEGSTEGYYSSVYVKSSVDFKIVVKDIRVESEKNALDVKEERKNIFISIKDVGNTTKSLENDEVEIVVFRDNMETQKLTFLIWLDALAGEDLEGAQISFVLDFVAV